jgi:hypothetical protein
MARARKLQPASAPLSNAELLALYREGLAKLATAQEVEILGKRIRRADLKDLRETVDWLERKVSREESGSGGGPTLYDGRIVK